MHPPDKGVKMSNSTLRSSNLKVPDIVLNPNSKPTEKKILPV